MHIRNSIIFAVMAAIYGFVFGFGYGNFLGAQYGFQLKDWQTLLGVLVAVLAAILAYIGVQGTQRINVMIKEQDRLDALLPGLRQVDELFTILRGPLSSIRTQHLYQASVFLESAIRIGQNKSVEQAVHRRLPLADHHLRREVVQIIFDVWRQAALLKVGREEVERYQRDIANIHEFAPDQHEGLLDIARQVEASHQRENQEMRRLIISLDTFAAVVKKRISDAEQRQKAIRGIVDKFFKEG